MPTPREIAQACHCQLLTGSYKGATRSCGCFDKFMCVLDASQRANLKDHPEITAAFNRNWEEYKKGTAPKSRRGK